MSVREVQRSRRVGAPAAKRFHLVLAGEDHTREEFVEDVRTGLTASPKRLSCRFLYDAEGSRIFEAICSLPEYYPFRAEREILERYAPEIIAACPTPTDLVELGSGSAEKTRHLIDALLAAQDELTFVPIDISVSVLEESSRGLLADLPRLRVVGVAGEYGIGLQNLPDARTGHRLFLWLGSNIGNLARPDALTFLRELRGRMTASDRLLMGVDLRKDAKVLEAAYDDAQGVTASFSLNLLARINGELGGDFDLGGFRHVAEYLEEEGRVIIHLESLRDQTVRIEGLDVEVRFSEGERIHTEDAFKYSPAEIEALATGAGFSIDRSWQDSGQRFVEVLLVPS